MWVELCDTDRDGKLSFGEFSSAALQALAGKRESVRGASPSPTKAYICLLDRTQDLEGVSAAEQTMFRISETLNA
jgi:hypothetical protein